MTALPLTRKKFTPQEYLMVERASGSRSEFLDGEIYAMSGASRAHVIINDNVGGVVHSQLKGTPCQGMFHDMKVRIGKGRAYVYPDFLIVYGKGRYVDAEQDVLLDPTVIFEILSPSTERYDRMTKFDLYKEIESLQDYILIAQDQPRVEHWCRHPDGGWNQNVISDKRCSLNIESTSVVVALADLYDRVEFEPESR